MEGPAAPGGPSRTIRLGDGQIKWVAMQAQPFDVDHTVLRELPCELHIRACDEQALEIEKPCFDTFNAGAVVPMLGVLLHGHSENIVCALQVAFVGLRIAGTGTMPEAERAREEDAWRSGRVSRGRCALYVVQVGETEFVRAVSHIAVGEECVVEVGRPLRRHGGGWCVAHKRAVDAETRDARRVVRQRHLFAVFVAKKSVR